MFKILRKITPFLLLSIAAILMALWLLLKKHPMGWGYLAVIFLFGFGLLLFLIDIGLKAGIQSLKKLILIQVLMLLVGYLGISYAFNRSQTFVISPDFEPEYISIVYEVDSFDKLGISVFTLNKTIAIPKNGILFTASKSNKNLPETYIKTTTGKDLNSPDSGKGYTQIATSEIEYNGQFYPYRTWKIQDQPCCFYSSNEVNEQRQSLRKALSKALKL